jgi:hemolysin activation/secretion protein
VVPGSVVPEHIERQFTPPVTEPSGPAPQITPQTAIPQTAISGKLARQFVLKHIEIEDVTVYKAGTFEPLFKDKMGQVISLAEAREIARQITTRYRTDGYVLSQAVIPNQDLETGTLHVRVVEGFIDKVYVENENPARDRRNLIAKYAEKIRAQRPLNTKTLERYMLLIDDLPGVTARAIIRPSPSTFGAADLVIQVKNKGIEGSFTSDNRGNKYIGPYQEQLTLTENSLAGLDERTTVRGINTIPTSELHFFDVQNEEQLDSEGTRLILIYSDGLTFPGKNLSDLDIEGQSQDYSVSVTHPFLRSRAENFTGSITFDARNTNEEILGSQFGTSNVRALRVGGNYDTGDKFSGVDSVDAQISEGLPWFDASPDAQGTNINGYGHRDFTKFNLDLSRLQNLPHGFSFLTAATGQYSPQALFPSEQFTLGGVGFGQAYDSGEVSGDSGLAGRVELRYGQPVDWKWFDSYQLYSYYDIGAIFLNETVPGTTDQSSLASTGVGVRANINQNLYGYLEVGFPLTRTVASEDNKDPRFFFSVTGRF